MNARSKKIIKAVTVDSRMSTWLKAISARSGLSEAEQIRRGIQLWLESYECNVGEAARSLIDRQPIADATAEPPGSRRRTPPVADEIV